MSLPPLDLQIQSLTTALARAAPIHAGPVQVVVAPYRICPLGAHVDHQGGEVLGRTIDAYSVLAYIPTSAREVRLTSRNYPGEVAFRLGVSGLSEPGDWGRYVRGAAKVLTEAYSLQRGIQGIVAGTLPAGGLSSSAAAGLAYLHGLAGANRLEITPWEYIELDRRLENDYLGLDNGILDQSIIELARPDSFVHLDTRTQEAGQIRDPVTVDQVVFIVAYSGYPRDLVATGFNQRVAECWEAARLLGKWGGVPGARILSDVPEEVYRAHRYRLPVDLRKRARHYHEEVRRVRVGKRAWSTGDFQTFGRLMTESCASSIHHYECGTAPIIRLHEIVTGAPGVLGGRFSGGGYGGCALGLVESAAAKSAMESIKAQFIQAYPARRDVFQVFQIAYEGGVQTRSA